MKGWWGKPTKKEWTLYFLIMLFGFIFFWLWAFAIGPTLILLYRKYYKKENINIKHWTGTKKEIAIALIILLVALIVMIYFFFYFQ